MRILTVIVLTCAVALSAGAQTNTNTNTISLPEGHEFTNPDRHPFSLSQDGTQVTYLARATLFVKKVTDREPTMVSGPLQGRGKTNPVFSPDGRSIVYWASDDSVLQRVSVAGGTPVTLAKVDQPSGLSWGADDQILVGQGAKGVVRVSANGGVPVSVLTVMGGEVAHGPQMLPGGNAVLFTLATGDPINWDQARIVVQTLKGGQRTTLGVGRDGRYLPSGQLVYVSGSTVMVGALDIRTMTLTNPTTLATNVQTSRTSGAAQFSVSANGVVAYVRATALPISLALVGLDGARTVLGEVPAGTTAPRVSADGNRVTFAAAAQIYVADINNVAGARKVISNGTFPLFSPDGQWLAFGSLGTPRESGQEVLFMQRADGSGEAEVIAKPARAPEHWPAGDQGFTFITHRGGANNYDLWVYSVKNKEVEPLAVVNESAQLSSSFSPDRKWVSYMSTESGDWQVYVQPYPATGAKYQVTTQGGRSPMWAGSDRLIYDNDGRMFSISLNLGTPTPTFGKAEAMPVEGYIQPLLRRNWDLTPDRSKLLMLFRPGPQINIVVIR